MKVRCIAALASSQRLAPNSLVLIFPAEYARTEGSGLSIAREAGERGTKTKTATSCGNVFETNFLLASAESDRRNGKSTFHKFPLIIIIICLHSKTHSLGYAFRLFL